MSRHKEVQKKYIAEMRNLQSVLLPWWMDIAGINEPNEMPPLKVSLRWPTAFSGHPRAIEVFRRYFIEIEDLNNERENTSEKYINSTFIWGEELENTDFDVIKPADLLIFDIEYLAPDIYKFVSGIVFVPVGLNQYDEVF